MIKQKQQIDKSVLWQDRDISTRIIMLNKKVEKCITLCQKSLKIQLKIWLKNYKV